MNVVRNNILSFLLLLLTLTLVPIPVQAEKDSILDLDLLSLMEIKITSAGRKEQNLTDVAAAIYVIDQEDICNSGATSIMDLLRRVPGLQVARISSNQWAISSRGFNGLFANKLLVQMDGRSIYTPTYSGVYWSLQNIILKDIDRIEIIRGPGATLWGANAVNGIINVITKKAIETQGGLLSAASGNHEKALGSLRYGFKFRDNLEGKLYAIHHKSDAFELFHTNRDAHDASEITSGGFRLDGDIHQKNSWTIQGDLYTAKEELLIDPYWTTSPLSETLYDNTESFGGNLLGHWKHQLSEKNSYTVQMYLDYSDRDSELLDEKHTNFDFDFQHNYNWNDWNETVWGVGYRSMDNQYKNSDMFAINSNKRKSNSYSAFIQNETALLNHNVLLTLGVKLDHNDYDATEVQPSARVLWKPADNHRLWAAVSRAARTSSFIERSVAVISGTVPGDPDRKSYMYGDPDFKSEELIAYEAGYRYLHNDDFSIDLATFYNTYKHLRYLKAASPSRVDFTNDMQGNSIGLELSVQWHPLDWIKTEFNYSYIKLKMEPQSSTSGGMTTSAVVEEKSSPRHQLFLHAAIDLSRHVRLNLQGRYVDNLNTGNQTALKTTQSVNEYVELDANICWQIQENLELKLAGQNLLDSYHLEFISESFIPATEVGQSFYAKLTWEF